MKSHIWPIRICATTTAMNGKRRTINAIVEGAGDPRLAILNFVLTKKKSYEWFGCEVRGYTPLGQTMIVEIEPNQIRRGVIASQIKREREEIDKARKDSHEIR